MALAQQIQLQGEPGARDRARRLTGSPALRLVGRRLLAAIPVLIGVTLLTFTVMSALPHDTAQAILGLHASPSAVIALNRALGLDQPFWQRYWHWLANVLQGNFGTSVEGASINHELAIHVPTTLGLLLYALVVSVGLSIVVASLAARRPNGIADRLRLSVSTLGLSTALYVFAFLLIIVFAVKLSWFPVLSGAVAGPGSFFKNLTLPACAIGFGLFAIYTRLLRADVVEQMQREDYIVTAKAKGVAPWRVLIRHALRNSTFNLITVIGLNLGGLVGAAAIIETIFQVQGIGNDLLTGISNHDAPLVEGITLIFALVTLLGNLLADLAYAVLDPRIRYGSSISGDHAPAPRPATAALPHQRPPATGAAAGPRAPALGARRGPRPAARHLLPAAAGGHAALVDQREHHREQRAAVLARALARHQRAGRRHLLPARLRRPGGDRDQPGRHRAWHGHRLHARDRRRLLRRLGGRGHLAAARHPDRLPRPGARAGDRGGARAERGARDRGAVGVQHPGVRTDRARGHADDPRAALHDGRAALRHPGLADHRPPHPAEHHARRCDVQPAGHRRCHHPGGRA